MLRSAFRSAIRPAVKSVFGHVAYPSGAILHFDANEAPYAEQTGGPHTFNHAILSPQFQRQADGSSIDVGAKVAADFYDGERWVRSCGALTNLFAGDSSIARAVSLTNGTVYTLQVFGAGTVSCSYGEATVASPLKITATATESVTFTPTGATYWMLTATAYPVPYVPPGVTQPASNATATNGMWFANPDGSPLWKALDGKPGEFFSGVQVFNAYFEVSSTQETLLSNATTRTTEWLSCAGLSAVTLDFTNVYATCNRCRVQTKNAGGTITYLASSPDIVTSSTGKLKFYIPSGAVLFRVYYTNVSAAVATLPIQRIQPQPLTLGTRVRMGVGSGDFTYDEKRPSISSSATAWFLQYFGNFVGTVRLCASFDGTALASVDGGWPRNAIIRRVTQVNTAGTQFRVGYIIEGTHTSIQWDSWVAFDGSFNPSTLYRLMLGYNNAYPMWFSRITAWPEEVSDARILEAMS